MRYRYRPVFDGHELIAFAYWTGEQVQHYYVKKSFFVQSLLDSHTPTVPYQHVIKSLDKITLKDYPPEVQAGVKQLRLGQEALTDELPQLKQARTNQELREFVNWFRRKASEDYGKHIKLLSAI
ncbi:MAG TPA: hypothetical protein ENF37_05330 [Beggiatoa sp.]|nr:MAG: hypothetical protein B6247_03630 [Beggiatoa sp. 4572_84]RKZ60529.1 MAG: hypothetical protein DRR08_11130 [Gammaproteobacteria bacterium]HEW98049.1 hypothetical protein [Beggiatoa sp.]